MVGEHIADHGHFDLVQYGRLLGAVDGLREQLAATALQNERVLLVQAEQKRDLMAAVQSLETRLEEVEGRFKFGRGFLVALTIGLGATALSFKEILQNFFGR